MTLTKRYKKMNHLPGDKEWILLKEVCLEVDGIKKEIEIINRICKKVANMCSDNLNKPTYGPMLEDKE